MFPSRTVICVPRLTQRQCLHLVYRVAYQRLKGWRPVSTALDVELFFLAAGTLCIALGVPILIAALNVKEYKARYDNAGPMANITRQEQQQLLLQAGDAGVVYPVDLYIEDTMKPPVG